MNGDFIIHLEDYADAILGLPAESAGRLFLSLVTYAKGEEVGHLLDDDLLARTTFSIMKSHIDRDRAYKEKMSAIGKKGGAPVGNSNASKTTKNNQKQAEVDLGCFENKQKQRPNPKPNPKPKENKRPYGECANVFLTDEEYKKIKDEGLTGLIEELSLYIESKGVKYKSHYATIRQWAKRRKQEQAEKKVGNFPSPYAGENSTNAFNRFTQRDIDFSDLEKSLIKN